MLIETLSNAKFVKSVFKSHLNPDDGHIKQLNTIAHLTAFKSWSNLQQFLESPRIVELNNSMTEALDKEKRCSGLFPSSNCLIIPIQCFVMQTVGEQARLDALRLVNLFSYLAFHGALNILQSVVKKHPLLKVDDRPCLAVGYDLTKYTIANLFNQINYLYTQPLEVTNFLNKVDIFVSTKQVQTIIQMDQCVFRDGVKTKSFLPAYWAVLHEQGLGLSKGIGGPPVSYLEDAIDVHIYHGNDIQEDTALDVAKHCSITFLLMPLQNGSFGVIKRTDAQGTALEYKEQDVRYIAQWCAGDFTLTPLRSDMAPHDMMVVPHE